MNLVGPQPGHDIGQECNPLPLDYLVFGIIKGRLVNTVFRFEVESALLDTPTFHVSDLDSLWQ